MSQPFSRLTSKTLTISLNINETVQANFYHFLLNILTDKLFSAYSLFNQTIKFLTGQHWKYLQTTKMKLAKMMIFVLNRVENSVGKGENAGYQSFQKGLSLRVVNPLPDDKF